MISWVFVRRSLFEWLPQLSTVAPGLAEQSEIVPILTSPLSATARIINGRQFMVLGCDKGDAMRCCSSLSGVLMSRKRGKGGARTVVD